MAKSMLSFELGKTLQEINAMPLEDIAQLLAFKDLRNGN